MAHQQTLRLGESTLSEEMVALQETVASCVKCGTCTGSCPVAMDYTPRAVMRLIMANRG